MGAKIQEMRENVRPIYAQFAHERRLMGLTQKEVARICGISHQLISFMETGRADISVRNLFALADFFNKDVILKKK